MIITTKPQWTRDMNSANNYNPEFPERFNWSLIDSRKLTALAETLAAEAQTQLLLSPEARILLPGLRHALRVIAELESIR